MPKMGIQTGKSSTSTPRRSRPAGTGPVASVRKPARQAMPLNTRRASLASALFSATQQRVLGLLFGQPERSFFATELIALAGAGSGAVQREVQRLAESGLVNVTKVGNRKHYQANADAPIFAELHGIVFKTLGPAEALRAALTPLAPRLRAAWLYGSVAKGTDNAQSDIDALLVAPDDVGLMLEEVFSAFAPAEKRLGRKISVTLYTESEFARRMAVKNPFLTKVMAGERVLLIGEERGARPAR